MRKKKKTNKLSSKNLSSIDKFVYSIAFISHLILWFGFFLLSFFMQRYIIFYNGNALAYSSSYWQFLVIIPLVLLGIIPLYFIKEKYENGIPLFMKSKKNRTLRNNRKSIHLSSNKIFSICLIIGIIVINITIFIGCFIPRTTIERDGSIATYNIINKLSYKYPLSSVSKIELSAYESYDLKSPGQDFRFQIRVKLENQKEVYFFLRDFQDIDSLLSYLSMFDKNMISFDGDLLAYENYCNQNGIEAKNLIEYLQHFQ